MTPRWWSHPRRRPPTAASCWWLWAALAAGCDGRREPGLAAPLFDDDHVPDVLVESRNLEPPPSLAGNVFVRGWVPWRERLARFREATHLVAQGNAPAVLSVVNLGSRPRTLELVAPRLVSGAADA